METWSELCRCCLSSESEISLLDLENKRKFFEITSIEVTKEEKLPKSLCSDCHSAMSSAYEFRNNCLKMDKELKIQIDSLLQDKGLSKITDEDESETLKQLQSILKTDNDSDDDFCYVIVIDGDKNDTKDNNLVTLPLPKPMVKTEKLDDSETVTEDCNNKLEPIYSEASMDAYTCNKSISPHVPDTILENEEQEILETIGEEQIEMEEDNTQEIIILEKNPDDRFQVVEGLDLNGSDSENNIIKLLTYGNAEGRIVLKKGLSYLNDQDDSQDEEVIYYQGDDAQIQQLLKSKGSELVIEYEDETQMSMSDTQISTVIQQEDGSILCQCGEQLSDLTEYEEHQTKHVSPIDNYCQSCGKGFESPEILIGHEMLHNVSGYIVECPFCHEMIKRVNFTQHIKNLHSTVKPKCSICFKIFANNNNLKRHMHIHTGRKEFECDVCLKQFHQKITMQVHKLTHVNPFACGKCDMEFKNLPELTEHKESNSCTEIKLKRVQNDLFQSSKRIITTGEGNVIGYSCGMCDKMFSIEAALQKHFDIAHLVDPGNLLCSECGEVLLTKRDMQTHLTTHKSNRMKNSKRFECSMCGKGCTSQAMLIMHERVHTNERPFPCQLCSLRFKTKTHLRTHQLTHTKEKKFGCSVCMKFFALKGNLVVHLRTHTGERPYVCDLCDDAFIDSKYLKKHKLRKHLIDPSEGKCDSNLMDCEIDDE